MKEVFCENWDIKLKLKFDGILYVNQILHYTLMNWLLFMLWNP